MEIIAIDVNRVLEIAMVFVHTTYIVAGTGRYHPSLSFVDESLLFQGGKVILTLFGISHHALTARLPICRTHFSMLIDELNGLQDAQGLINIASNGQVIDGRMTKDPLVIDDKETTEGYGSIM